MSAGRTYLGDVELLFGFLFLTLFAFVVPAFGQTSEHAPSGPPAVSEEKHRDYVIGPNDILSIGVGDWPQISGRFRVTDTGYLVLPGLPRPIKAQGLSAPELSKSIAEALQAADLMREPMVNVFVEQYRSRSVTVVGAVMRPSVYPIEKPTTLLEVLSLAGGLAQTAGSTVTVARHGPPPGTEGLSEADLAHFSGDWTQTIDSAKLMEGKDPSLNIEVHAGDVVNVSTAPIIYIMGAVTRQGGFVLPDSKSGVTVLQALAMAEGLKPISGASRSVIIRRSANADERQEIPIDVTKLMTRKLPDQALEPNDILLIPESSSKKSLHRLSDAAVQGLNTLAIYAGYRVALGRR